MTKAVRIENACMSNFKVRVRVYDKGVDGAPDVLAREVVLHQPTAMTDSNMYITSTRYIIVDELPADSTS